MIARTKDGILEDVLNEMSVVFYDNLTNKKLCSKKII